MEDNGNTPWSVAYMLVSCKEDPSVARLTCWTVSSLPSLLLNGPDTWVWLW